MSQLLLNRIEDLISIVNSNIPKIFLDTLGKSDLEHAPIFAYALLRANGREDVRWIVIVFVNRARGEEKRRDRESCS